MTGKFLILSKPWAHHLSDEGPCEVIRVYGSGQAHTIRSFGFIGGLCSWLCGWYTWWFRGFAKFRACLLPPMLPIWSSKFFAQILSAPWCRGYHSFIPDELCLRYRLFWVHSPAWGLWCVLAYLVFIRACWNLVSSPGAQTQDRRKWEPLTGLHSFVEGPHCQGLGSQLWSLMHDLVSELGFWYLRGSTTSISSRYCEVGSRSLW